MIVLRILRFILPPFHPLKYRWIRYYYGEQTMRYYVGEPEPVDDGKAKQAKPNTKKKK